MMTESRRDKRSRDHQLWAQERGNTNTARPRHMSSSSTRNSHSTSSAYVFCAPVMSCVAAGGSSSWEAFGESLSDCQRVWGGV